MKIVTGIKNGILKPFKWLFSKKRRWIPIVVVLALIGGFFLAIDVWSPWGHIHYFIADIRYQISEKSRQEKIKEDYRESKLKWESNNISDYEFTLKIYLGGQEISEGSHGRSYGAYQVRLLTIKIDNSNTINIIDSVTTNRTVLGSGGLSSSEYDNKYPYSILELFNIVKEVLDNQSSNLRGPDGILPFLVEAEFNTQYGFPEFITIYAHLGNLEFYNRLYLVTYEISEFKVIE